MVVASGEKLAFPKRMSSSNLSARRNGEGIFCDVQNDITIDVDGVRFALHKFPISSRCGRIRKLVAELKDSDPSELVLINLPGGTEGFELAVKFCYGVNFKITTSNVAYLRCAADYLEMTEDYGEENLLARTETYMSEVVLLSWEKSVEVLISCEKILPFAEEMRIVNRCIDALASMACRDQMVSSLSGLENCSLGHLNNRNGNTLPQKAVVERWAEHLAGLRIDLFQRALQAMRSRGLRNESIGGALMHYAQRSLKSLSMNFSVHARNNIFLEHEQRIVVETIVSLLPAESSILPTNFLIELLRTAIILDTTVACRLDIERRIGSQLEQATLDDILIPCFSHTGETLFDVDIVHRVLVNFLQQNDNRETLDCPPLYESKGMASPSQRTIMRVAKLVDSYLAEIAPDPNLKASKFIALAELLPDYARVVDDGLYRAIDIYLKAHPTLSELERKKICKLMDCQKLSGEACTHAAQNERLPVQFVVQVLYFEQLRLKNALAGSYADAEQQVTPPHYPSQRISSGAMSAAMSPRDNYSTLRRENRELKLEVARLRVRLAEIEKEHVNVKQDMERTFSAVKIFGSFSKQLGKINPFSKSSSKCTGLKQSQTPDANTVTGRRKRHSIS